MATLCGMRWVAWRQLFGIKRQPQLVFLLARQLARGSRLARRDPRLDPVQYNLLSPTRCQPGRQRLPVDGARWLAASLAPRCYNAGCPRYAQANAPQARGLFASAVGHTRLTSILNFL